MARALIRHGRWTHRARRELLKSDLASIINALMAGTTDAVGSDTALRALEYRGALPARADQAPAFGLNTWGETLELMIDGAPPEQALGAPAPTAGILHYILPHFVEARMNPLRLLLMWLGPDGVTRRRIEIFGPSAKDAQQSTHGPENWMVRETRMDSRLIVLAGRILSDNKTAAARRIAERNARNEAAAALAGAAAARKPGQTKAPGDVNTPKLSAPAPSFKADSPSWSSPPTSGDHNPWTAQYL
jgi:hypothetical protein